MKRTTKNDDALMLQLIPFILVITTVLKILLIPAYKSTDFDVHRNWLAITRNLPIQQWYFDSVNGTTVHTLDYPPSFAYFEYFLSKKNPLTTHLIERGILNWNCLALLGDHENDIDIIGYDCVVFQRCTVILFDVVFWIGCFMICQSFHFKQFYEIRKDKDNNMEVQIVSSAQKTKIAFILLVTNPGLILLDHVHFQYNGMLIGILLGSIAMFLKSIQVEGVIQNGNKSKHYSWMTKSKRNDLVGAILFALLLTFKHMYLTLAPLYFFYLLRRFCFVRGEGNGSLQFSLSSLILLGGLVLITLIGPFVPFFRHGIKKQMMQILSRLFPWQRGLCHDYWAGNVWALYLGLEKVMKVSLRVADIILTKIGVGSIDVGTISFPIIGPKTAAILLLVGLSPAFICGWRVATSDSRYDLRHEGLLFCFIFSALSSFMLAYHVHEKAIMTAIVPMTVLSVKSKENARLFLRLSTVGHFGLLPLLYKSTELGMKVCLNVSYLVWCLYLFQGIFHQSNENNPSRRGEPLVTMWDKIGLILMSVLLVFGEIVHRLTQIEKLEFLPLMLVSIFCAVGLLSCWIEVGKMMVSKCFTT